MADGETGGLEIVYDGECPFCSAFVTLYRIRRHVGTVTLTDARARPDLVRRFANDGLDINEGMVALWDGRSYHGADAMRLLAMLGQEKGAFAAMNRLLFRNPAVARAVYPVLVKGRGLALRLLGRRLIARPSTPA